MHRSKLFALFAALVAVALIGAACGDDDDETASAGDDAGGGSSFCDAYIDANVAFGAGPDVDFDTASEEEIREALAAFADTVNPLMDDALAAVPAEIEAELDTVVSMAREALETGDDSVLGDERFTAAERVTDDHVLENCDLEVVRITGVDYAFEGVPADVPAGRVALVFENGGQELHEVGLARVNDGVTESVEEILNLAEEPAEAKVTFLGGGFAPPGERDVVYLELTEGRYGLACFIPVGTTPEVAGGDEEPQGPPHFTQGMFAETTVS